MPITENTLARKSILLIEDDTELTLLMTDYFGQHGFSVEAVHDGRSGLARSLEGGFDLIILDVMLPHPATASNSCANCENASPLP